MKRYKFLITAVLLSTLHKTRRWVSVTAHESFMSDGLAYKCLHDGIKLEDNEYLALQTVEKLDD